MSVPTPQASQPNLYEHLANELDAAIAGRVFAPGERLPSVRRLSLQKQVSISTVMQAMRLLERRGLVDVRPQAGFYVRHDCRRSSGVSAAPPLDKPTFVGVSNLLMQVLRANVQPGMAPLGASWPPDELLPVKSIQRIMSSVTRRQPGLLGGENCVRSNEPAFVRQVQRRALDWGRIDASEIVVTASCTEAISLSLRAVAKPGDTIAVESATYFVLLQLIESLGMKALEIPSDPVTGLSLDALELAFRSKLVQACLLIPNANNPTGSLMPEAAKRRLAALLAAHDVPLIEDDVYGDLCYTAQRPPPVKAFDRSGHVLLCSSFSKAITPAVRVGYVAAGRYAEQVMLLKTISSGVTGQFFQAVLADYLDGSAYEAQLRKMRRALSQRVARMGEAVTAYFPAGCTVSAPQGGMVLWVALPDHIDALELHRRAHAERIAFMPGVLFSASGKLRHHLRLNCGNPWNAQIAQAIRRLGELVDSHGAS